MSGHPETVVLVHGLWVHGIAMSLLRRRLGRGGYRVFAYSYPSVRLSFTENVGRLAQYCRDVGALRSHFVGHSMGGLIVLHMLEETADVVPGRVILAGTPVAGSHAARSLARLPGGRVLLGRSIVERMEAGRTKCALSCEIGVIAGRMPVGAGRFVAPDLPVPHDGAVSVEETRLPAMKDHIVLNVSHSGMLFSREVGHQVDAFLSEGAFDRANDGWRMADAGTRKAEG
jgi:pimeloyl-ACP methyl ester carboxylesterase